MQRIFRHVKIIKKSYLNKETDLNFKNLIHFLKVLFFWFKKESWFFQPCRWQVEGRKSRWKVRIMMQSALYAHTMLISWGLVDISQTLHPSTLTLHHDTVPRHAAIWCQMRDPHIKIMCHDLNVYKLALAGKRWAFDCSFQIAPVQFCTCADCELTHNDVQCQSAARSS